ncbi:MAG: acetyl-CoA hydrolase, partial [Bacillus sp. (in: firmicutes)]
MEKNLERIRDLRLRDRVVTPEQAASWIQNGMTLGLSGFTRAGDVKAVPVALVNRVKDDEWFKVNVYTGASLGSDVDKLFAEAG